MSAYAVCKKCGARDKLVPAGRELRLPDGWQLQAGKTTCPDCAGAHPEVTLLPRQRDQATGAVVDARARDPEMTAFAVECRGPESPGKLRDAIVGYVRMQYPAGPLTLLLMEILTAADWTQIHRRWVATKGAKTAPSPEPPASPPGDPFAI